MIEILERKHAIFVTEFDRYVAEHPEFAVNIPRDAQIVIQLEDDEEYNEWSRKLAEKQREKDQRVVYVTVKGLKPADSPRWNIRMQDGGCRIREHRYRLSVYGYWG